ncbi:MAG: RsiV family protein [Treponema sp.]|nr:RsiV family protein [Treponema sp.]
MAVLSAGLLAGSCASGGNSRETAALETSKHSQQKTGNAAFAVYSEELRIPLWNELPPALTVKTSPILTIKLECTDFAASPAEIPEQVFNSVLYRGLNVRDYARELVRVQTIEYQEMGEEARNNPAIINSASLNWEYSEYMETPVAGPRLLVISRDRAFYKGGAHPNSDRTYFVFDREAARQIRLSDIIRKESEPALKQVVNRELRAGKNLGPGDSLKNGSFFVDEAELPEDFFLSPQGLGFHWNPYEIAPYSEGHVETLVSSGDIRAFLSPGGQRLTGELWKD